MMQIKSGTSQQLKLCVVHLAKALTLISFNFSSKSSYFCLQGTAFGTSCVQRADWRCGSYFLLSLLESLDHSCMLEVPNPQEKKLMDHGCSEGKQHSPTTQILYELLLCNLFTFITGIDTQEGDLIWKREQECSKHSNIGMTRRMLIY